MQRRETKLGLRFDPKQADDFEVPARLDGIVKEGGLAGSRRAVKHQGGAAAPPRRLKDAVDFTALQLTVQQHGMSRCERRSRRNACICPLPAGHSGFTRKMRADLRIRQLIVGPLNRTPLTVPARLPRIASEFSAAERGKPRRYRAYAELPGRRTSPQRGRAPAGTELGANATA